jgi:SulP family sulfate permease
VGELAVIRAADQVIGFVESVSVGKTLAAKRRQRIDANQELLALGAANVASAVSGGFPVTGGFSRSVVNFDAGAQTQLASVFTAVGIALAALVLTPVLYYLPKATLAATIIVAVTSLIDWRLVRVAWRYSRADFAAVAVTICVTLLAGVELGRRVGDHRVRAAAPAQDIAPAHCHCRWRAGYGALPQRRAAQRDHVPEYRVHAHR